MAALTLAALSAQAASEPAVIYDTAGKFDKSFNEAVSATASKSTTRTKASRVKEFEPPERSPA